MVDRSRRRPCRVLWTGSFVAVALLGAVSCGGGRDDQEQGREKKLKSPAATTISTTTTMPTTTTTAPPVTTTTVPPTTTPPRLTLSGTVDVLDRTGVWFEGQSEGGAYVYQPPPDGSPCVGTKGYEDIGPGGPVVISDGAGVSLATSTLGGGTTVQKVVGTDTEWREREHLIDSIYDYRSALTQDPVRLAELNVERARLRLGDLEAGGLPDFEGHPFRATWCQVSFSIADLPIVDSYGITVTHRGTTSFSRGQIEADGGRVLLTVG